LLGDHSRVSLCPFFHTGYRDSFMGPERVRVTFSHQYGFVAHAPWLPPQGICASSINALRNGLERARPRVSMEFTLILDRAAKARYGMMQTFGAMKLRRGPVSLARRQVSDRGGETLL
jgi:hypothetical protein